MAGNNPQNIIGKGFKPGISGNPKGRTPGSKNMATIVRELLEDESLTVKYYGRNGKELQAKYPGKALARVMLTKALEGDIQAANFLRKTAYGDKVDMTVSNAESALSDWHNNLKEQDEQFANYYDNLANPKVNKPRKRSKKQSVANDTPLQDKRSRRATSAVSTKRGASRLSKAKTRP